MNTCRNHEAPRAGYNGNKREQFKFKYTDAFGSHISPIWSSG